MDAIIRGAPLLWELPSTSTGWTNETSSHKEVLLHLLPPPNSNLMDNWSRMDTGLKLAQSGSIAISALEFGNFDPRKMSELLAAGNHGRFPEQ